MSILGLEHILASHVPACLENKQLGVVAWGVHSEGVRCYDFLLKRKEDLGVLCIVCSGVVLCFWRIKREKGKGREKEKSSWRGKDENIWSRRQVIKVERKWEREQRRIGIWQQWKKENVCVPCERAGGWWRTSSAEEQWKEPAATGTSPPRRITHTTNHSRCRWSQREGRKEKKRERTLVRCNRILQEKHQMIHKARYLLQVCLPFLATYVWCV